MSNPFDTDDMAAGYANSRPAVHPRVLERVFQELDRTEPFCSALDVGCGAGVSTRALRGLAAKCVGLEPNESMLRWARTVAPFASFIAGAAESIPVRGDCVDLITTAGSLNYVDLDLFFPEAARILTPGGVLVVYDFSPGRSFRDATSLDEWFSEFSRRYPLPASEARDLSPAILADLSPNFRLQSGHQFEIGLPLTREFYVDYIMTETNVAAAVRCGIARSEIRSWSEDTLGAIWGGSGREVLFRGYFACLSAT